VLCRIWVAGFDDICVGETYDDTVFQPLFLPNVIGAMVEKLSPSITELALPARLKYPNHAFLACRSVQMGKQLKQKLHMEQSPDTSVCIRRVGKQAQTVLLLSLLGLGD
jgi:hypothetical protein